MDIHTIISEVANIGSTKAKQAIIEENSDNEVLKQSFYLAESPRVNFYVTVDFTSDIQKYGNGRITLDVLKQLERLSSREVTGNAARDLVNQLCSKLTFGDAEILCRIINKDLRCNAGTAIANKVWPKLIPEYPMMLASKGDAKGFAHLEKHVKKGLIAQKKCDGGRVNVIVDSAGEVTYRSRSGSVLNLFGRFDEEFTRFPNQVFDGELLVKSKTGVVDRKTGNGFYTKAVRGTLSEAEASNFCMEVWDMVPIDEFEDGKGTVVYRERLKTLNSIVWDQSRVKVVEGEEVFTMDDVYAFYNRMRAKKEEGAIIKVADSVWEDRRSKNSVKMKAEETADLLCIGWERGTGKNADKIGNLIFETACKQLLVNVGTGFSDEAREKDPEYYLGTIWEIGYNEVISSKGKDTKSLFLPVLKVPRPDKTKANTLAELK